jgi:hypothetical protein
MMLLFVIGATAHELVVGVVANLLVPCWALNQAAALPVPCPSLCFCQLLQALYDG